MKKVKRFLSFAVVFVVLMMVLCSVSFAATVGQQLTSPESGWQRYDDTDLKILYEGNWTNEADASPYYFYNGNNRYTSNGTGKIKFVFKGSELRYIGRLWDTTYTTPVTMTIDGIEKGSFYQKSSSRITQCINYEITDLENSVHTVEISSTGKYSIDAIDIDDTGTLLEYYQPQNLQAAASESKVILDWTAVTDATNYNIKRATTSGGPYTTIATSSAVTYTDSDVTNGTTYYYVVTAVISEIESSNSNEASATPTAPETPPVITGNSAILELTMTTGEIKEYDLTASELEDFLTWYDERSNGADKAYYVFDEKNNIKPFLSRKEYVSFDNISSFEVKEYAE